MMEVWRAQLLKAARIMGADNYTILDEPAPVVAERELADGWIWHYATAYCSSGAIQGHVGTCKNTPSYRHDPTIRGACEAHADKLGVFKKAEAAKPMANIVIRGGHLRADRPGVAPKPCRTCGGVPFTKYRCPTCKREAGGVERVRVTRVVGDYYTRGYGAMWASKQAPTGQTGTLIASEKPPAPLRPAVRGIYRCDDWRDADWLPNGEV